MYNRPQKEAIFLYYNQKDYGHVPYPAKGYEAATVKSGGCGPCCAAMVAEGLSGLSFPPEAATALAISTGARVSGGTHMGVLGRALGERFGLAMAESSMLKDLTACLGTGGWAIANVSGNRSGYTGLFSDGGHYVTVRAIEADGHLVVWDPGLYAGKFDREGRKGRAEVRGNDVRVAARELELDCGGRSPRYYLFTGAVKADDLPPESAPASWAKACWERAVATGVLDGTSPQGAVTREQLAVVLGRLGLV